VTIFDGTGTVLPATAKANRFLYTGREWIQEVGLYDYRNRVYSPELGRFLQTDPIRFEAGDVNIYRYVGNSPLDWVDPEGLMTREACMTDCDNKLEECLSKTGEGALIGAGVASGLLGLNKTAPKTPKEIGKSRSMGRAPNERWTSWSRRAFGEAGKRAGRVGSLPVAGIGAIAGAAAVIGICSNLYIDCISKCPCE
jgi:RHS repeat-associated protein